MKVVVDCRIINVEFHHGLSRFCANLVTELHKLMDFTVIIHDTRQLKHLPADIPYIVGPKPSVASQHTITKQLNDFGADIVFAPTVFFTIGKRNFKLIGSLHDTTGFDFKGKIGHEAKLADKLAWRAYHATKGPQKATLQNSDHVITVSQSAKQAILRHKLTTKPITVIYNAPINVTPVKYNHASKTLVYMGSFFTYKNVATLIQALNYLPGYNLVCLSKIHPKTKANLLKHAADPSKVTFINGVTDEQYVEQLSKAAALVTASRHEGFGLPLIEAQATGIPVICSDIQVFHEVCEGKSALFFNPDSPEQFADCVKQLPGVADTLITAGHANAKRFSWAKSAEQIKQVIESLSI